eukprot:310568-Chlamydomonas_euryale.AAC.1
MICSAVTHHTSHLTHGHTNHLKGDTSTNPRARARLSPSLATLRHPDRLALAHSVPLPLAPPLSLCPTPSRCSPLTLSHSVWLLPSHYVPLPLAPPLSPLPLTLPLSPHRPQVEAERQRLLTQKNSLETALQQKITEQRANAVAARKRGVRWPHTCPPAPPTFPQFHTPGDGLWIWRCAAMFCVGGRRCLLLGCAPAARKRRRFAKGGGVWGSFHAGQLSQTPPYSSLKRKGLGFRV